ncbi:MAG: prepilin-type N-terminal cleavage/methylation domain-containing protein [Gammaproteobacteria bacterium]
MLRGNGTAVKGFALLEVLLALALAASVLGAALPALATTLARLQEFHTTANALALAKAKLTEFKYTATAAQPVVQGREDAFYWQLSITDLTPFPASTVTGSSFVLQELTVRVALQAQGAPLVELKTHRIEPLG